MALIIKPEGTKLRVDGTWLASQELLEDFAEYLWNHGYGNHGTEEEPIEFADLTTAQKLALLDAHIIRVALDCAADTKDKKEKALADIITKEYKDNVLSIE